MHNRFILDPKDNILFIDFAGLRIKSREQVEEMARHVRSAVEARGRRVYAVVNYEGTEIGPEIVDYYGDRIKELQDRYAISTVRHSSSGLTRSVLRYLGAARDLESNIFTTRDEAIRSIREMEGRSPARSEISFWKNFNPRNNLLAKLSIGWLTALLALTCVYVATLAPAGEAAQVRDAQMAVLAAALIFLSTAVATGLLFFFGVVKPLRQMDGLARSLVIGGAFEPIEATGSDEVGRLGVMLNEAAQQLRRDIERLSGLYHISLMMGTGTEVSRICELLTRKIARLLGADMCVILLYDEHDKCIHAQLPAFGISDEEARLLRLGLDDVNIASRVFTTGEPYLTNEAASDDLISRSATLPEVRAVLAVPLRAGERTIGTLEVMNKEGGFVEEDKRLVTIFASQAAHLLVNAQLFEQVRESEERYRRIFESTLDGLSRNTPDGRFTTVNPSLTAMLGYKYATDLVGTNLFTELLVDSEQGFKMLKSLDERGQVLDVECEMRRRTGETLPTRISVSTVTDDAVHETYLLCTIRDVGEQQRLSEQLKISEQLAVVGELVAGVAHEVRNPLCGITTTLGAMARRLEDTKSVQPFLDVMMTEADHLNRLMEELLEHSRPIKPDNDLANIRDVIYEVMAEWKGPASARDISLTCKCPEGLPGMRLDRRKMHAVFANLLDNALHHTDPGGTIELAVGQSNGNGNKARVPKIRVEISDTGQGIAPGDLRKIFDPFFTTRTTGTGLGLAIVRKTIHDHGGTITARSQPGVGTSFTIDIPLENGAR